ncbi:MAG: STAS domain-containing protein [bacterium]
MMGVAVVRLDSIPSRDDLIEAVDSASDAKCVLLDLTNLPSLSGLELGWLWDVWMRLRWRERKLGICGARGRTERLLKMTHLEEFIPLFRDVEEGISSLGGDEDG